MAEQSKVRANSKLEQKLDELYYLLESAKPSTFFKSKVVIDREVAYEILEDMRKELPEELKKYHEMTNRYGLIIGEAQDKATTIEREARDKQTKLINEHEIVRVAYDKANEMVNEARKESDDILMAANQEADVIREGAFEYTQNMMQKLHQLLSESFELMDNAYRPLMEGVGRQLDEVDLALHGLEEPNEEDDYEEEDAAGQNGQEERYDQQYDDERYEEEYEDEYEK